MLLSSNNVVQHIILFTCFQFCASIGDHMFLETGSKYFVDWCYDNPTCGDESWLDLCSYSSQQSPMNLPFNKKILRNPVETVENFPKSKLIFNEFKIEYIGHTIQIKLKENSFKFTRVEKGLSIASYTLVGLDFHWGKMNSIGSEHTINRRSYAGEVHLAFIRDDTKLTLGKYVDDNTVTQNKDILVVGAFLDVDADIGLTSDLHTSKFLHPIVAALNNLQFNQSANVAAALNLQDLFRGNLAYKYPGSFTTPSCKEVEWWVMLRPVVVPLNHLKAFRNLKVIGAQKMENNYRPLKEERAKDKYNINEATLHLVFDSTLKIV